MYFSVKQLPNYLHFKTKLINIHMPKARHLDHSKSMMAITSYHIEGYNFGSQPNSKNYGEKDAHEACRLNPYPIINHGSSRS